MLRHRTSKLKLEAQSLPKSSWTGGNGTALGQPVNPSVEDADVGIVNQEAKI